MIKEKEHWCCDCYYYNGAANIGVRLLMLYADRICDEDTYAKLFKTLRQMPTRGIFSDDDIARFTNNGKR